METMSEQAAAVYEVGQALLRESPIKLETLEKHFYQQYVEGCTSILVDIDAALLEKADTFNVRDIKAPSELVAQHEESKPLPDPQAPLELAQDEFEFNLKQAKYDMDVYRVWSITQTRLRWGFLWLF